MVTADEILEGIYKVYRDKGYNYEKDFPGEYQLFYNEQTGDKVRVYHANFEPTTFWMKTITLRILAV